MDWLEALEAHFIWLAIGLVLGAAEILIPGVFLIWLATAALLTGLVAFFLPVAIPLQIVVFAALAIVSVFIGRNYLRRHPIVDVDPKMNRRTERLVGESAIVVLPIEGGQGRIKVGDSEWLARGQDMGLGTRVRITGSDGAVLLVEPL